jgi:protein phosphatase
MNEPPKLSYCGLSDIGLTRPNNEDVWIALEELGFFALADGMGGHQAGEVAAKEAVENLSASVKILAENPPSNCSDLVIALRLAIEKANRWVYEMGRDNRSLKGMGTTLCCIYWTKESVIYAHVGDSRIYRYRKGKLEQLTNDHSLFSRWLSLDKSVKQSETAYPYKNVITRAIGTSHRANPEIAVANHEPGDLFFLCSDGLSDVLSKEGIEKILEQTLSMETMASHLIEQAKIKGSHDNITVLIIKDERQDAKQDLSRQQLDDSPRSESIQSDVGRSKRPSSQPL